MSSATSALGNVLSGLSSNSWYSIQAFATDYYLGLNSSSSPVAAQLSNVEDRTLWQFVAAGPDANRGVYAVRSKASEGKFCLYDGCDGPELCVDKPPAVRECGNDAGEFQIYNSSSEAGGLVFTTFSSNGRAALSVDGSSSEGDAVNTSDILTANEEVGYQWAIRSEEGFDTAAYPATFTPTYDTITTSATLGSNTTTTASASSTATDSVQVGSTVTQVSLTTFTPGSTATTSGDLAVATVTSSETSPSINNPASQSSAPAEQTGSIAAHTRLSLKAALLVSMTVVLVGLSY